MKTHKNHSQQLHQFNPKILVSEQYSPILMSTKFALSENFVLATTKGNDQGFMRVFGGGKPYASLFPSCFVLKMWL
jgi:hypothetical protein